jgi:hypothetical protein
MLAEMSFYGSFNPFVAVKNQNKNEIIKDSIRRSILMLNSCGLPRIKHVVQKEI